MMPSTAAMAMSAIGDIFFPANWMKNLLAGHKSEEARQMIERFLKSDKTLSDNLKNKVLDAAWVLMKQEPYQEKIKAKVVNNSKSTVMQKTSTNTSTKNNNKKKK